MNRLWRLALLLSVFAISGAPAFAARPCLGESLDGIIQEAQFNTGRGLPEYLEALGPTFKQELERLGPQQRWIDAGSGECRAIQDYALGLYHPGGDRSRLAKVTGITFAKKQPLESPELSGLGDRFQVLKGRFLEDIPDAQIGKADLITDLYGVMAYTKTPDVALQKYFDALEKNGVIYLFLGKNRALDRTRVRLRDETEVTLAEWIKRIPGVVTEQVNSRTLRIAKKAPKIFVPKLELKEVSRIEGQAVPSRYFVQRPAGTPPSEKPGLLKRLLGR